MLSERDRRTLAEIEQHLLDDDVLSAVSAVDPLRRRRLWRNAWIGVLALAGVLAIGIGLLGVAASAVHCVGLGLFALLVLWFSPPAPPMRP